MATVALAAPMPVTAARPTFHCTKAQGTVEALVCGDPALAARDRELAAVYKTVAARAKGKQATTLRAEQRGWVKGRNECWKAQDTTWITATWTVNSVTACIDAQYRLRTSELQATWHLIAPTTVAYACQNDPANEVVANYFATDPPTIRLERGDRTITLWGVGETSLRTYEGPNVSAVHKAPTLQVNWLDTNTGKTEALRCSAR